MAVMEKLFSPSMATRLGILVQGAFQASQEVVVSFQVLTFCQSAPPSALTK